MDSHVNRSSPTESEFDKLLAALIEPGLTPSARERLGTLLDSDPALRERYLEHCQMHAILSSEQGLLAAFVAPDGGPSTATRRQRHALSGRAKALFSLAAAVALVLVPWEWLRPDSPPAPRRGAVVAKIGKSVGARFEHGPSGEDRATDGAAMRQGEYHLLEGLIEIEYPSGAVLVLQAPAVFDLVNSSEMRLEEGQLSAHVPETAIGFRVNSPGATVIDLGTDFAVQAVREQASEVHVFQGEVLVNLRGQKVAEAEDLRLATGEAARIDFVSGMPAGIDLDRQRFVRSLRVTENPYARQVLALDPAVYYRMEPTGDGARLIDSSPNAAHAAIHFGRASGPVWGAGKIGSAFALGGPAQRTFASAASYPRATGDTLSVVAWINAKSRPRWASIVKNWAGADDWGQFHFGLYNDSGELEAHIQDSSGKEITVRDSRALPLQTWHHVAFVADGKQLRLFRNGEQVDAKAYRELRYDARIEALAVGTKLNLDGTAPEERDFNMWDGRLDEIAIFNYSLSPDMIRALYEAGSTE